MSTLNAIKGIRNDLSRDIAVAQKSHQQMAEQLRTLAANLKAAEATVTAKVRFLASLDAIQREADQALAGVAAPVRQGRKPGPSRKNRAKVAGKAKAVKAAAKAPTIKPDEVKIRRKPGRKTNAEKAALRIAAKAEKTAARMKRKAEREVVKASAKVSGVKLTKEGRPAKKPGPRPGTPRTVKAAGGAKVTKVKAGRPGQRSNGVRPSTKDAIFQVLNGQSLTADDIFKALKVKGWLPNSNDPRNYIAYLLSSTKDRFERVKGAGRGVYRCKAGAVASVAAPIVAPVVEAPKAEVVEAPKAEVVATDGTLRMSADDILTNAGVLGEVSFGG